MVNYLLQRRPPIESYLGAMAGLFTWISPSKRQGTRTKFLGGSWSHWLPSIYCCRIGLYLHKRICKSVLWCTRRYLSSQDDLDWHMLPLDFFHFTWVICPGILAATSCKDRLRILHGFLCTFMRESTQRFDHAKRKRYSLVLFRGRSLSWRWNEFNFCHVWRRCWVSNYWAFKLSEQ